MFDIIFLILLLVFLFRGYRKGVVVAICSLLAIILGVVGAMKLSAEVALIFFKNDDGTVAKWAPMVSYLLLFFVIVWLVRMLAAFIQKSMKVVMLGWIDQCAGALLYGFMFCFIWSTFLWLGSRLGVFNERTKSESRSWAYVSPLAPMVFSTVEKVIPFARSAYDDFNQFYGGIEKTIKVDVDTHR